jgi:hypothetical protein
MDIVEWRSGLQAWLEELACDLEPGRFRFCLKGNMVPTSGRKAQFATCFAVKAAWQAGLWDNWTVKRRSACEEFVRSFQLEDGWFVDPWLKRASRPGLIDVARFAFNACRGRSQQPYLFGRHRMNLRAETRQTSSTLLMVKSAPRFPLPIECPKPDDVRRFLDHLDWTQPWGAGSHLSHLLFMWTINRSVFGLVERYGDLVDVVMDFLSGIRDPDTQCWHRGNPPVVMKINGAMKVLSGLQWIDRPYPDCSRLMDLALSQPFERDGCGFFNRLLVVRECRRGCPQDYRTEDIVSLAERALLEIATFRKTDGGFSFYSDHAQTHYYGARVSKGFAVSDIHGAAMMVWATAICLELIGGSSNDPMTWRAHKA